MRGRNLLFLAVLVGCSSGSPAATVQAWHFTDATVQAGLVHTAGFTPIPLFTYQGFAGGLAAADYDNDGFVDLYVLGGDSGRSLLYKNLGNGRFADVAAAAGVNQPGVRRCGPSFADYDGDGHRDLFVGGMAGEPPVLLRNRGDGTFEDVTAAAGLVFARRHTIGAAWADYDNDGDLDLATTHYNLPAQLVERETEVLWRNDNGVFTDVSQAAGITAAYGGAKAWSFTPNFADIDNDGDPDLLLAADFGTSRVFKNNGDGTFSDATTAVIDDENGMGAAIGDYDNDGDLDWFVSSIFDADGVAGANWGISGNRLYQNDGTGTFLDVTDAAGVREGFWGWGSSFVDLNNDGDLDLLHVNGADLMIGLDDKFRADPTRLFVANGDGTFLESSADLGLFDDGLGLGVVCFDYDQDGDLDIFVWNYGQPPSLYRNDGGNAQGFLRVRLEGSPPNAYAIGARIFATHAGKTQMREIRAGNNYVSQSPDEAWFGLGPAPSSVSLRIVWPDAVETTLADVTPNRRLVVRHPEGHRPSHFGEAVAQTWHTYRVFVFAIEV